MSYRAIIPDHSTGRFLLHGEEDGDELPAAENAAGGMAAATMKGGAGETDMLHLHECAERAFSHATDSQPYP